MIIREILDKKSVEDPTNRLDKRFIQSNRPKSEQDLFTKKHLYTFRTKKFKYILEVEEYPMDIFAIAFRPVLNADFGGRRQVSVYSHMTNDPERLKVLNTAFHHLYEMTEKNPMLTAIFFGAPDTDSEGNVILDKSSKRYRIYVEGVERIYKNLDYTIYKDEPKSAIAVIPNARLREDPDHLEVVKNLLATHN
jgi:hypothetical protein